MTRKQAALILARWYCDVGCINLQHYADKIEADMAFAEKCYIEALGQMTLGSDIFAEYVPELKAALEALK